MSAGAERGFGVNFKNLSAVRRTILPAWLYDKRIADIYRVKKLLPVVFPVLVIGFVNGVFERAEGQILRLQRRNAVGNRLHLCLALLGIGDINIDIRDGTVVRKQIVFVIIKRH